MSMYKKPLLVDMVILKQIINHLNVYVLLTLQPVIYVYLCYKEYLKLINQLSCQCLSFVVVKNSIIKLIVYVPKGTMPW